jgi:hypothetical protein
LSLPRIAIAALLAATALLVPAGPARADAG